MSERNMMTTREIAKLAGVSDSYIRQLLIKDKQLHGQKFGHAWAVSRRAVERWLKDREERVS